MLSTVCFVIPLLSSFWCSCPIPKTRRRRTILHTEFLVLCPLTEEDVPHVEQRMLYCAQEWNVLDLSCDADVLCPCFMSFTRVGSQDELHASLTPTLQARHQLHTPVICLKKGRLVLIWQMSKHHSRTSWSFKMEATRCAETSVIKCDVTEDLRRSKTWKYWAQGSAQWRTVVNGRVSARVS